MEQETVNGSKQQKRLKRGDSIATGRAGSRAETEMETETEGKGAIKT